MSAERDGVLLIDRVPRSAGVLDGHVEAALSETDAIAATRPRGPLRPAEMISARSRHGRRRGAHAFRIVDIAAVVASTGVTSAVALSGSLFATTVGSAIPYVVGATCVIWSLASLGGYHLSKHERLLPHLSRVVFAVVLAAAGALASRTITPDDDPTVTAVAAWAVACAAVLIASHLMWWLLVRRWRTTGRLTPNIVIVGATAHAEGLIGDALQRRDMHVLGIFDDRGERSPLAVLGVPVLGTTDDMLNHKIIPFVDLIVVAVDPTATARVRQITSRLAVLPNQITLVVDRTDDRGRATAIAHLADAPLAPLRPVDEERRAFAKRMQDLIVGVPLAILAAPVVGLIALAVRLDSRGPVFFRQRRHGFNNEEIVVWKFRTMRHEAADQRAEQQVTANDSRVTRVGRLLRSASLDEIPQLINVLKGEMSLVGPRPHAIGMKTGEVESAKLVAEYAHRHRIKPGMTGWAAIKGSRGPLHAAVDVSRRVELDIDYIDRHSLWLDLWIMAVTVPGMLGDRATIR